MFLRKFEVNLHSWCIYFREFKDFCFFLNSFTNIFLLATREESDYMFLLEAISLEESVEKSKQKDKTIGGENF